MSTYQEFAKGIFAENPLLKIVLGLCPALAVTSSAINGIGMGVATLVVLVCSNLLISLVRNHIPENVRIPAFIVVIASFVTIVDFSMAAYTPALHDALGIFIPLIVVNCIVMGRAEAFASKNTVVSSVADGLGMGLGFTWALLAIGAIRELLGAGTLFGAHILGSAFQPATMLLLPPGGFLVLGMLLALINFLERRSKNKSRAARHDELVEAHRKTKAAHATIDQPEEVVS